MTAGAGGLIRSHSTTIDALAGTFDQALQARPDAVSVSYYRFAGRLARVRVVGKELSREVERPFAHLRLNADTEDTPELLIDLWDETATGVCGDPHDLSMPPEQGANITASPDGRVVFYEVANITTVLDRARRHIIGWTTAADQLTIYQRSRPLTGPLLLWLMDCGVPALHAGLVAKDGRGLLIGGPSGAGKSTVSLACAQAGFDYLADDHIGLEVTQPGSYLGHSLFCSANLEPGHLGRFPSLFSQGIRGRLVQDDKSMVLLSGASHRLGTSVPIRAVVLPRVTSSPHTTWRRAARPEALLRIAPSSLFLAHARGLKDTFQELARLLQSVPAYWVELGRDISEIPDRLSEILSASDDS